MWFVLNRATVSVFLSSAVSGKFTQGDTSFGDTVFHCGNVAVSIR
ncbi:Uncharacterised protein [Vibrio cholerae]|nr:Uncharacterised protein [Vibrio cholerae]